VGRIASTADSQFNYFRDYDPSIGRYVESDPFGLAGGINTYADALDQPIGFSDPEGGMAQAAGGCALGSWAGPIGCVVGAAIAVVGTIAVAAVVANSAANARERQAEYEAYKAVCDQKNPTGLDPCAFARWKFNRNLQCMNMRQQWDDKWMPGRQAKDIADLKRGLKTLEEWIKRNCGNACLASGNSGSSA